MLTAGFCATTLAFVFSIAQPEGGLVLLAPAGLLIAVGGWLRPRRDWRDWVTTACGVVFVILGLIAGARLLA